MRRDPTVCARLPTRADQSLSKRPDHFAPNGHAGTWAPPAGLVAPRSATSHVRDATLGSGSASIDGGLLCPVQRGGSGSGGFGRSARAGISRSGRSRCARRRARFWWRRGSVARGCRVWPSRSGAVTGEHPVEVPGDDGQCGVQVDVEWDSGGQVDSIMVGVQKDHFGGAQP
jgi:hypothetical protein